MARTATKDPATGQDTAGAPEVLEAAQDVDPVAMVVDEAPAEVDDDDLPAAGGSAEATVRTELAAMRRISDALEALHPGTRARVLRWMADRYQIGQPAAPSMVEEQAKAGAQFFYAVYSRVDAASIVSAGNPGFHRAWMSAQRAFMANG